MKLYFYRAPSGNFGDDLNEWLWPQLFPNTFDDDNDAVFVGIGTILDDLIPTAKKVIVFGSGAKGTDRLPKVDDRWDIRFVRGPLSAEILNLEKEKAISDGAYCLGLIPRIKQEKIHKFSFMPHISNVEMPFKRICDFLSINYIDPRAETEETIKQIESSQHLITEAMHGAIVADICRVPWLQVRIFTSRSEKNFSDFKWRDYRQSVNSFSECRPLPSIWPLEQTDKALTRRTIYAMKMAVATVRLRVIMNNGRFIMTEDRVLSELTDKLATEVDLFKRQYLT